MVQTMSSQYHNAPNNLTHFFKIILQSCLRDGELRLPRDFVRKYGENLPNPVFLTLPNGAEWEVSWVKHDGDVYFQKGWKEFAEHYSLAHGHFLVFRYEGESKLQVLIFDMSALEIIYPTVQTIENCNVNDSPIQISDDCSPWKRKRARSSMQESDLPHKMRTRKNGEAKSDLKPQFERSKCLVELETSKPKVRGGSRSGLLSTEKALMSAKASCSKTKNPYFIQIIYKTYINNSFMGISNQFSRKYLNRKKGTATLRVSEEKSWSVKFFYCLSSKRTFLGCGWKTFVEENNINQGDVCVFEMTGSTEVSFRVAIFHVKERPSSPSLPDSDQPWRLPATSSQIKKCFTFHVKPHHVKNAVPASVPWNFAKRYVGSKGKYVTVKVGKRSWTLKVVYYSDYWYARFSAGWPAFLNGCKLKPGNTYQFELIDEKKLVLNFTKI